MAFSRSSLSTLTSIFFKFARLLFSARKKMDLIYLMAIQFIISSLKFLYYIKTNFLTIKMFDKKCILKNYFAVLTLIFKALK